MKNTNNTSKSSVSSTSSNGIVTKTRTKARKPPVAERMMVTGAVVPTGTRATASTPAVAPAPAPTPAVAPAPAATSKTKTKKTKTPSASAPASAATAAPAAAPAASSPGGSSGGGNTADAVDAPPAVALPTVPSNFVPANPADLRGYRPMASEIAAVPDAVTELQGFTGYTALFGITAPPVDQLTQRLGVAAQWTSVLSQTTGWYKYVKSQEGMAWKDALVMVEQMKVPFQLASTANPALLSQYPGLARLLGASTVVAKRAVATKKRNQAAATGDAADAGAAGATSAPAAGTTGANGANEAAAPAAAATRVVTVQG